MPEKNKRIQVTGDMTVDWMIMSPHATGTEAIDFSRIWGSGITCKIVSQAGGAALLSRLIQETFKNESNPKAAFEIAGPMVAEEALSSPAGQAFVKTFSLWSLFPEKKGAKDPYAWRIHTFLGEDSLGTLHESKAAEGPSINPDYLVIDDSNLGFRNATEKWPQILSSRGKVQAVILKMTYPLAKGKLWTALLEQYADVLTVVISINDLRKESKYIGYALSWEQMFEEIVFAVQNHDLHKAARIVVCIGASGAVLMEPDGKIGLVFAPFSQEGDWEKEYPGFVMGHTTCMATSLVYEAAHNHSATEWRQAVKSGLQAGRTLLKNGYSQITKDLQFPFAAVAAMFKKEAADFTEAEFTSSPSQSILGTNLKDARICIAMDVVINGPEKVLKGIPIERIGVWSSVDRVEIESIRSVRNIMSEYVSHYQRGLRLERPLSIAVFGPPGSGKSFAIKQVANALLPGELKMLEFNLSQFKSINELSGAFHRIRDLVLSQYLPLVFWDEFDTPLEGHALGWLRHFLAPMQDGEFREEGVPHPIGPAVFVFAGGTCSSLPEFELVQDPLLEKNAKKPDFISRLRGYVNILGPNPMGETDKVFMLRRAFLLRSLLLRKAKQLFENGNLKIDQGVSAAFIGVDHYLHGARSMEAIIDMSMLSGKLRFERSSLPAKHQLALHVNADKFLTLVKNQEEQNDHCGFKNFSK